MIIRIGLALLGLALYSASAAAEHGQSCAYQRDGVCDEIGIGTEACSFASDPFDCAGIGYDTCELANNGICDEPNRCPIGSDTSDCRPERLSESPVVYAGMCAFQGDGQCDEPGIGTGLCDAGTDAVDCGDLSGSTEGTGIPVEHSCQYAFDGECDEPQGTDYCAAGTDRWDCALPVQPDSAAADNPAKPDLMPANQNDQADHCAYYGDGQCDEPGIGTGLCPANSDALDCVAFR